MIKKFLCITLSALLLLSLVTGCGSNNNNNNNVIDKPANNNEVADKPANSETQETGNFNKTGFPIVNEKVTLRVAATKRHDIKNFAEMKLFQELEEKTNVEVKWELSPNEGWDEKKGLIFAGGELPDAFYGSWTLNDTDVIKYGSQGLLIPLEDLIEEYAPNVQKVLEADPMYKKSIVAPDGHIYALPAIDESTPLTSDAFFINKEWLDKVGKDIPTTTDEFYEVLKAFKEAGDLNGNGKDDEIPFTFRFKDLIRGVYSFFGSFGLLDNREHIVVKDGEVIFTAVRPEYKEAIKYFHKLYSEGLIDNEAFTQDAQIIEAKIKSPERILGAFCAWSRHWAFGTTDVEYVPVAPLKGPNGEQAWNRRAGALASKGAFAITNACENPEVAMRWIDAQYEPEFAVQAYYGLFDVAIKKNPDGTIEQIEPPAGMTTGELRHQEAPGASSIFAITREGILNNFIFGASAQELDELDKIYEPYLREENYPPVFFTLEETEQMATLRTDIIEYVDQMYAKWVTDGGIEEEWDAYIKQLNNMGLEEMMRIYQDAYDRYKAAN